MGSDTTGVWAALGINTFFVGENATDIAINPNLVDHPEYINAASIDGQTEGNEGDGLIAQRISKLAEATVKINTPGKQEKKVYYPIMQVLLAILAPIHGMQISMPAITEPLQKKLTRRHKAFPG